MEKERERVKWESIPGASYTFYTYIYRSASVDNDELCWIYIWTPMYDATERIRIYVCVYVLAMGDIPEFAEAQCYVFMLRTAGNQIRIEKRKRYEGTKIELEREGVVKMETALWPARRRMMREVRKREREREGWSKKRERGGWERERESEWDNCECVIYRYTRKRERDLDVGGVRGMFQTPLLELEWEYRAVSKHPLIFRANTYGRRRAAHF